MLFFTISVTADTNINISLSQDGVNYTPVIDYMTDGSDISNDETIVDPDTGELINQTEASIRISEDPNSGLAVRCKQIWSTINNMYNEQNIVRKY